MYGGLYNPVGLLPIQEGYYALYMKNIYINLLKANVFVKYLAKGFVKLYNFIC